MSPLNSESLVAATGNLASLYDLRFKLMKDPTDLDRAIELSWTSVKSISPNHPKEWLFGYLGNLAGYLRNRFKLNGNTSDLEELVKAGSVAVGATPLNSTDRPSRLYELGLRLGALFEENDSVQTLDKAIEAAIEAATAAVEIIPADQDDRLKWFDNVANLYGRRYERLGNMADLNKAVEIAEKSWSQVPRDHPYRLVWGGHVCKLACNPLSRKWGLG